MFQVGRVCWLAPLQQSGSFLLSAWDARRRGTAITRFHSSLVEDESKLTLGRLMKLASGLRMKIAVCVVVTTATIDAPRMTALVLAFMQEGFMLRSTQTMTRQGLMAMGLILVLASMWSLHGVLSTVQIGSWFHWNGWFASCATTVMKNNNNLETYRWCTWYGESICPSFPFLGSCPRRNLGI